MVIKDDSLGVRIMTCIYTAQITDRLFMNIYMLDKQIENWARRMNYAYECTICTGKRGTN